MVKNLVKTTFDDDAENMCAGFSILIFVLRIAENMRENQLEIFQSN